MSQNYAYNHLVKQTSYPTTGLTDGSSVLVVASDGSLQAVTIAGLQNLISTQTNLIQGNLTVYGTIFTPNQPVIFEPILANTDCGVLGVSNSDAFGVNLGVALISDFNFQGALQANDLGVLS